MSPSPEARAAALSFWRGKVELEPLSGGLSNHNFVASHGGERFVVRIGDDLRVHGVLRVNELAASRAAHAAGLSPEVVYWEPGAMVLRYIEGARPFSEADVREPGNLARVLELVRRCHTEVPRHLEDPVPMFWVFHVIHRYGALLNHRDSRLKDSLPRLLDINDRLEAAVGPVRPILGHNDCLAANFIDDGERLWLIDWEYAGYNSALFDLGGVSANCNLAPEQEEWLLEAYYRTPVTDTLRHRYAAMKCAWALRESLWSAVSEIHLTLDVDYVAYTEKNLTRFERAYEGFARLDQSS